MGSSPPRDRSLFLLLNVEVSEVRTFGMTKKMGSFLKNALHEKPSCLTNLNLQVEGVYQHPKFWDQTRPPKTKQIIYEYRINPPNFQDVMLLFLRQLF